MPNTQRNHTIKLIEVHRRRLYELQLDAAQLGSSAPPQIAIEIADIEAEIAKQEASLTALDVVASFTNAGVGAKLPDDRRADSVIEHRLAVMVATVQATVAEVGSVKRDTREAIQEVKLLIYRITFAAGVLFLLGLTSMFVVILSRG